MKKNKILKIFFIIMLIIIVILIVFAGSLFRKHLIIKKFRENLTGHIGSNDYSVEEIKCKEEKLTEYYFLDGKILEKCEDSENGYYRLYENGLEDIYINYYGEKYANLGQEAKLRASKENDFFRDCFYFPNKTKDYICFLINVKISSEKYDGKDCYWLDMENCSNYVDLAFEYGQFYYGTGQKILFEKETGLIRENLYNNKKYNYKFGGLTEKDFEIPNVLDYSVVDDASAINSLLYEGILNNFPTTNVVSAKFNLKFANFSGEHNGATVKELLSVVLTNMIENKDNTMFLPDIVYLEENSDNSVKENMINILDLDEGFIEILTDEEEYSEAIGEPFKFIYNAESSFKIVSSEEDNNAKEIVNLGKQIDENQNYKILYLKNMGSGVGEIYTIIINKR